MKTRGTETVSTQFSAGCKTLMSLTSKVMLKPRKNAYTQTYQARGRKPKSKGNFRGSSSSLLPPTHRQRRVRKEGVLPLPECDIGGCNSNPIDSLGNPKNDDSSHSVEISMPFVDTTAIKDVVNGVPEIVQLENDNSFSLICVRKYDGLRVTRTFNNISELQTFIRSGDAQVWLIGGDMSCQVVKIEPDLELETSSYRKDTVDENVFDATSFPKRIKQESNHLELESITPGIQKLCFLEKSNSYKIDYIHPSSEEMVTRVFKKFSLLLNFLQEGEVRGALLNFTERSKRTSKDLQSFQDVTDGVPCSYLAKTVKCKVENLDSENQKSSVCNISVASGVSVVQSFSQCNEAAMSNANKESVDDLELFELGTSTDRKEILNRSPVGQTNSESKVVSKKHVGVRHNIDTSNIKPLIVGYPKVSYSKRLGLYRIVCIRFSDGLRVSTTFRTLPQMQEFLDSEDAESWLMDECGLDERVNKRKPCPVSYDSDLLVVKPEITFIKPNRLRVLCIPKSGRPKTKFFRCSDKGQSDLDAMKRIDEFLTSESFLSWMTADRACETTLKDGEPSWLFKETVRTGTSMRMYLDGLVNFDCTKTVDVNPVVSSFLEIHHNPDAPPVSVTQSPKWGRVHRSDDTFTLSVSAPPDLFKRTNRILTMYVRCSSRSNMCRTACGALLTDSQIVDGHFSCCSEPVPDHNECSHCKSTTSSYDKWHKMGNGSILCRVCYNYQRKKNVPRPLKSKKMKSKPFYIHNQCQYKLRIELLPDLEHWKVYYNSGNNPEHNNAFAVGCKRFTLTERDYIDKVRSSVERLTARQIETGIPRTSVKADTLSFTTNEHQLTQYQSRCKVVDNRILDGGLEEAVPSITIDTDWKDSDFNQSCETEVDCIEFEISDVEPDILMDTTAPTIVVEAKPNTDWNINLDSRLAASCEKKSIKVEEPLIICYKCVIDPNRRDDPFSCRESRELESHIKACHRENYICCSICFKDGIVESFPSLRLLNHHIRQFHNRERSFKKSLGNM